MFSSLFSPPYHLIFTGSKTPYLCSHVWTLTYYCILLLASTNSQNGRKHACRGYLRWTLYLKVMVAEIEIF